MVYVAALFLLLGSILLYLLMFLVNLLEFAYNHALALIILMLVGYVLL